MLAFRNYAAHSIEDAPAATVRLPKAQDPVTDTVLRELRSGRKQSHWMWFIFPQLRGLGRSPMARNYGIDSLAEARAYLSHVVLGPRLKQCVEAVLEVYPTSRLTIRDRGYWLKRTVTRLRDRHDPVVRPSLFQVSASSEVLGGGGRTALALAIVGKTTAHGNMGQSLA